MDVVGRRTAAWPRQRKKKVRLGVDIGVNSKVHNESVTQLTVSKLAEQVGTSTDTLRYYERIGLLPQADRSSSGYRLFSEDAVERVAFIKRAQRLGLRLDDIRELLQIKERGLCPCGHTRSLLEQRARQLDDEMAEIVGLRADIQQMLDGETLGGDMSWKCGNELLQIRSSASLRRRKGGEI